MGAGIKGIVAPLRLWEKGFGDEGKSTLRQAVESLHSILEFKIHP
jgi:hypothetical protein